MKTEKQIKADIDKTEKEIKDLNEAHERLVQSFNQQAENNKARFAHLNGRLAVLKELVGAHVLD